MPVRPRADHGTTAPAGTNGGRGGSTPDPTVVERVVAAVLVELAERGRDGLTMDRVAQRAGVSKTTVYTRWRTKEDLLVAAYRQVAQPLPPLGTGSLRGDIDRLWEVVSAGGADPSYPILLAELLAAASIDETLQPELRRLGDDWNDGIQAMFREAQGRGELADDVDVDLLTEALVAIALHRSLFKVRPIDHTLRAAIDTLVFRSPPPLT
jgi:AcrR family transcriptional regulator